MLTNFKKLQEYTNFPATEEILDILLENDHFFVSGLNDKPGRYPMSEYGKVNAGSYMIKRAQPVYNGVSLTHYSNNFSEDCLSKIRESGQKVILVAKKYNIWEFISDQEDISIIADAFEKIGAQFIILNKDDSGLKYMIELKT